MKKYKNIMTFILFFLSSFALQARIGGIGFFRTSGPKLAITTAAANPNKGVCTGTVTVQTQNASGVATNVGSNLTVNLSGSSLTFYSDSYCSKVITTVTVSSGSNSASFYYTGDATGTLTYTAAATAYLAASQSSTIGSNPFTWTGGGGNTSWTTGGNWSGGVAPSTSSHTALFDGTCSSNCSPTIVASLTIAGIRTTPDYTGTISQGSNTVTFGSTGLVLLGGTFNASTTANTILNCGNYCIVKNATLNANASIIDPGNWDMSGGTFNAGTSTVRFTAFTWSTRYNYFGSETYNNVIVQSNGYAGVLSFIGTMKISGTFTGNTTYGDDIKVNDGTIETTGNVVMTGGGFSGGTALLKLVGSSSQTVSSTGSNGKLMNFEVASTGGTVSYSGTLTFVSNYKVTSGTVDTGTSTVIFSLGDYSASTITPGSENYNNVTFNYANNSVFTLANNIKVYGILTGQMGSGVINSGTIKSYGDINLTSYGLGGGSCLIELVGSSQTISSSSSSAQIMNVKFNSTGTVNLAGTIIIGNYNNAAGSINAGTSSLIFSTGGWGVTTSTFNGETLNNVTFNVSGYGGTRTLSGTVNVSGILTADTSAGATTVTGGTINVTGSGSGVSLSNLGFPSGSTIVKMSGSSAQTISASGSNSRIAALQLDSSGGVTITGLVNVTGATTMISGTASLGSSSDGLVTNSLALGGNTFTKNGGTLTVNSTTAGTGSLYGGTVAP